MEVENGDKQQEIAEIFRRIRSRLNNADFASEGRTASLETRELGALKSLLIALETAHAQVGIPNLRPPGLHHEIVQFVKRTMARALSWYTRPLRQYQAVTNQLMRETIQVLEIQQAELKAVQKELGRVLATWKVPPDEKQEDRLPLEGPDTKIHR